MGVEEILWHIEREEDENLLEALFIDLLIKFAEKRTGEKYKTILDVACGHGRLHRYLRELGYEVWGIDINENLIEKAKERNKGFESHYLVGDMRNFDLGRKFDVVLSWFTSFGYFSDEENLKVLENFKKHLRKGGILILDIPTEEFLKREPWFRVNEYEDFIHIINSWSEGYYRVFKDEIWKEGRKVLENVVRVRVYPKNLMIKILESFGFEVIRIFGGYSIRRHRNEGACVYLCRLL